MTGIGKPFFNSISEANRASQIVREIVTNQSSARTEETTADDFYAVVETSYDTDLKAKGVSSSVPVTLSIVPFTKLTQTDNAQADILNIQRNLDTIATSNVNDVINYVTGTFTDSENLALNDRSQIDTFRSAVNKLTAAYSAKAAYMTHLSDTYGLETDSDFNNSYGAGTSVPTAITTVKITSLEKKQDWVESYLNLGNRLNDSYNIERLMQIVRNSFARKDYGDNFTIVGESTPLYVNPIDTDTFKSSVSDYFQDLADINARPSSTWDDETTNMIIVSDSKAVAYTRDGIVPEGVVSSLVGQLSLYNEGINLTSNSSLGIFSNLTKYEDGRKTVLPLDVNIGSQTTLQTYESADEYFLGFPLNNNKQDLKTRSDKFATDARSIESSLRSNLSKITLSPDKDLYSWNCFLSQMCQMIKDSFYTTNDSTSILRFSLLTTALQSATTRKLIFKIMMLRDRLRNPADYVQAAQVNEFQLKVTSDLEREITNLAGHVISPYLIDYGGDFGDQESDILAVMNTQFGKVSTTGLFSSPTVEFTNSSGRSIISNLLSDLSDTSGHQWDNFFTAAKNAEQGAGSFVKKAWSSGNDSLSAGCGITNSLLKLSRDQRAFLFFNKWLLIINDFPFAIEFAEEIRTSDEFSAGLSTYTISYSVVACKAYYSTSMYAELKSALTLTLVGEFTPDQFSYYFEYNQPISRQILQDTQTFYDGIDYVYRYIMQASSLLNSAADLAFEYTPVYGEKLSNHYTSNAILNLNRQSRFSFSQSTPYRNFSQDQYKSTDVLNGFFRYVQDDVEVPTEQDSFVVVCGIPYGMLDRLGAFNQNKIGYVDVTLTIRSIDGNPDNDVKIVKSYPINGYVEHQLLSYNTTTNATYDQVLSATSLYELSPQNTFVTIDQFDETSRKNELQSTALLNYIQLFYGLTFGPYIASQTTLPIITDQNIINAREKFKEEIYSYRFGELVESRYVSTGVNSLKFSKGDLITQALGGCVFDKVIAIPVDSTQLKVSSEEARRVIVEAGASIMNSSALLRQNIVNKQAGYLADVLVTIDTRFTDRIRTSPNSRRSIVSTRNIENLVSTLQSSLNQTSIAQAVNRTTFRRS